MTRHSRSKHQRMKNEQQPLHRPRHKQHRGLKIGLLILVLVLFVGAGYGIHLYRQAKSALDKTYSSVDSKKEAKTSKLIAASDPLGILLLGTDTGTGGRTEKNGNSDTIIVATVNPKTNKTTLTSIPRDTLAQIIGENSFDFRKINAANNIGGAKMALNSVSKLINVPLTYYVRVNMAGLKQIVNAIGGVDVTVPFDFESNNSTFTKGKMHLNGQQALDYAQMRYEDPEGDYGRQKRQRAVITSIVKSAMSAGTLANFKDLLEAVSDNMETNFTSEQMIDIFQTYRKAGKKISSDYLHGVSAYADSASVQIASTSELQRISDAIRSELDLTQETVDNATTKENKLNEQNGFIFENPQVEQEFTIYSQLSDTNYSSY